MLIIWNFVGVISMCLGDLCFNVAHWILAMFYLRIAKNMPRVYRYEEPKPYSVVFKIGMTFNVLGPICEAVFLTWFV